MDAIVPAAAAMKRRKLAEQEHDGAATARQHEQEATAAKARPKKRKEKEIDVIALARERREAEEEHAARDAESLREAMEGMDVEDMKRLVQTEHMEIKPRQRPVRLEGDAASEADDRWDPAWNGRKNFKKFRRRGESERMRGHRVIVGLEEVKRKGLGIGEEYWLEAGGQSQSQRQSQSQGKNQGRRTESQGASQAQGGAARKKKFSHLVGDDSDPEPDDEVVVVEPQELPSVESLREEPSANRQSQKERTQTSKSTGTAESSTMQSATLTSGSKKRSATAASVKAQPPAKRGKLGGRRNDTDDSDEDELKFRFRRRK